MMEISKGQRVSAIGRAQKYSNLIVKDLAQSYYSTLYAVVALQLVISSPRWPVFHYGHSDGDLEVPGVMHRKIDRFWQAVIEEEEAAKDRRSRIGLRDRKVN